MNLSLLNKTFKKPKELLILPTITVSLIFVLVGLQSFIVRVEASVDPISVSTNSLGFGIVFPGEEMEKEFIVSLVIGDWAEYKITQTPKPGYFDLCPFLEKVNEEGEGDTEASSILDLNSDPPDVSDTWKVVLNVPAILGFVAQDHSFGTISEGGEYGCDIGVEAID